MSAETLTFFVDGTPIPKGRPRTVRVASSGKAVTFTPDRTTSYEKVIRTHALRATRLQGWTKPTQTDRFHVDMIFYFADEKRRDQDNCLKTILDGLKPVVYVDDFHVASLAVQRVSCSGRPGVNITVTRRGETRGISHVETVGASAESFAAGARNWGWP